MFLAKVKGPCGFTGEIHRYQAPFHTDSFLYTMTWAYRGTDFLIYCHSQDLNYNPTVGRVEDCDRACIECLFKHVGAYVIDNLSYEYK